VRSTKTDEIAANTRNTCATSGPRRSHGICSKWCTRGQIIPWFTRKLWKALRGGPWTLRTLLSVLD